MKTTTILLALALALAYVGCAQAQCCRRSMVLTYTVGRGRCGDAGGRAGRGGTCSIVICAHGKRKVGTYCGRRSCNIFGCNCGGGCIEGQWQRSFINNNRNQNIRITNTRWIN
ncbi:protein Diedel [Drosophila mojavensis]|uniref:Protein Diedel n=1 Tax=Drosophila mojavensis TaxID=7230 RepID=B4K8L1_DROMO|nr:protein Diedel [Drosophila mojavensis]EDW14410.1 uncharacterized protein Dmoj_GI24243 [Drosophila mojavensis]